MTPQNSTAGKDEKVRNAALSLLRKGLVTQAEAAELAGVSRQVMNYWAQGINWRKARAATLSKAWRKAFRR